MITRSSPTTTWMSGLVKVDTLRKGDWDILEMPPMSPQEIREKWFLE